MREGQSRPLAGVKQTSARKSRCVFEGGRGGRREEGGLGGKKSYDRVYLRDTCLDIRSWKSARESSMGRRLLSRQ